MVELPMLMLRADQVKSGDMVDLEGDSYADLHKDHTWYPYELALVIDTDQETDTCVCIYFEGATVGFPPDHILKVKRDEDAESEWEDWPASDSQAA